MCLLQHSNFLAYFIERFDFIFLLRDSENNLLLFVFFNKRKLEQRFLISGCFETPFKFISVITFSC